MKQRVWWFVGLVLIVASLGVAGTFDASLVPNDARWIVHIDVAALRGSTIGQSLLSKDLHAEMQQQWQQAEEMLGMNLREDLHAVTMYGGGIGQDDVVVWIRGKLKPQTLASQATNMDGYQSSQHGRHTIHSWLDTSAGEASRAYGVVVDETRGLMGPSEAQIQKALQVMAGEHPNVTDGGIPVSTLTARGLLMAATADLSEVDFSENPMLAQANVNARNFRMQVRESDGTLGVRIAVQQGSAQEAQQAEEMLNGLKMMGMMQLGQQNPDLASFLQSISISRREDVLTLSMTYASEKVAAFLQQAAEQAQ